MTIPATQPTQVGDTSIALDGQAGYAPASKSAFGMKTQEPNENMSKPPPSPAKKKFSQCPCRNFSRTNQDLAVKRIASS